MVDSVEMIEGVRVALGPSGSTNGADPRLGVVIAPAAGPENDEQTIMQDGIAMFVDPGIAALLDHKVLDLVPAGPEQVQFTLTKQSRP